MSRRERDTVAGVWRRCPARLTLGSADVDVWCADLDLPALPLAGLARSLSADERRRAQAFVFQRDRERFIAARGMLRELLAAYLDSEPGALSLCYGSQGKPELATASGSVPLRFNCSHSQGRALYAIARGRRIGVDLEAIRLRCRSIDAPSRAGARGWRGGLTRDLICRQAPSL